ncbi:Hypothetical protein A7982_09902 [Minicystis rosea]|nr:Hypothetical protein A7982_09902 [Minicystis rosea]
MRTGAPFLARSLAVTRCHVHIPVMRCLLGTLLFSTFLAACGEEDIHTKDACEAAGGHVIESTGGQVSCPVDEEQIGTIPGDEPVICCR